MGFWSGAIKNMTYASDRPLNGLTTSSRPRCLCRLRYSADILARIQTAGLLPLQKRVFLS
jgi:hypothetical protein